MQTASETFSHGSTLLDVALAAGLVPFDLEPEAFAHPHRGGWPLCAGTARWFEERAARL